jgi:hypothetical protein
MGQGGMTLSGYTSLVIRLELVEEVGFGTPLQDVVEEHSVRES